MWEYPASFGFRFTVSLFNDPTKQPWLYVAHPDHPWFDHHERGHNRTVWLNRAPTMDY